MSEISVKTSIPINTCATANCSCIDFWQFLQQETYVKICVKSKKDWIYNLIDKHPEIEDKDILEWKYEIRARRIAANYAKIYLETQKWGNPEFKGRFYWMGLAAFASKTVASVFALDLTKDSYNLPLNFPNKRAVDSFAKGNLWLFMDITPWHLGWSLSPSGFESCQSERGFYKFNRPEVLESMRALPWQKEAIEAMDRKLEKKTSKAFEITAELKKAFAIMPKIEQDMKASISISSKQYEQLISIAIHEQKHILQAVTWEDWSTIVGAMSQRLLGNPRAYMLFHSDYYDDSDQWKECMQRHKFEPNQKKDSFSDPLKEPELKGTRFIVENYENRMKWINIVARKYHRLMQSKNGRIYMEEQLHIIASWENDVHSPYERENPYSNDSFLSRIS